MPLFRQEVSLYAAMPGIAAIYGRQVLGTLDERVGRQKEALAEGDADPDAVSTGTWGRLIGFSGHQDGHPLGVYGGGPEFDYTFGAVQIGQDLYSKEYENGQRDNAGLYLAVGQGELDVEHNLFGIRTFKAGENSFDAVSLGGYWTRFGATGWYLDGVVQATWYDMEMTARRGLKDGETDAFGIATSLEGGYPFDLGSGWLVEPQAQLVYQAINVDGFNDGAADIRFDDEDSLAGRIGAKLSRSWTVGGEGGSPREFTVWGRADLWHEFLGDPVTEFSSAIGFIPFTADLGGSWGRVGIGGAFELSSSTTLYGNVNYEHAFDGDAYAWDGKVGLKIKW